jgi:hypothetical protein
MESVARLVDGIETLNQGRSFLTNQTLRFVGYGGNRKWRNDGSMLQFKGFFALFD